ncbi:hypothetical protein D039_3779A, partial [Vibrio parahaemolyticus EKP-028]
MVHTL